MSDALNLGPLLKMLNKDLTDWLKCKADKRSMQLTKKTQVASVFMSWVGV